ncbi:hypothetical protein Bbelb_446190, partial [Branchiostoma belcheri]
MATWGEIMSDIRALRQGSPHCVQMTTICHLEVITAKYSCLLLHRGDVTGGRAASYSGDITAEQLDSNVDNSAPQIQLAEYYHPEAILNASMLLEALGGQVQRTGFGCGLSVDRYLVLNCQR